MRLIVTDSTILSRTIWKALNDPDGTVVTHISPSFVDLDSKTPFDEQNGFAPVWAVSDEKTFRILAKQARSAEEIILGHRDEWTAQVTEEALRTAGVTAPMRRVVFGVLTEAGIKKALTTNREIDRNAVDIGWRQRAADFVLTNSVGRALKKGILVEWQPTLESLLMLRRICSAVEIDSSGTPRMPMPPDAKQPTVFGAITRQSQHNSPAVVAQQIRDLIDYGLVTGPMPDVVQRLSEWCVTNLGDSRIDLRGVDERMAEQMLLPADPVSDLANIQPAYRRVFTDIWEHAVHFFSASMQVHKPQPLWRWRSEASRWIRTHSFERAATLGALRDSGLVFGWSYVMPTETGVLVNAVIQNSWPKLADQLTLQRLVNDVTNLEVDRRTAIMAVRDLTTAEKPVEMPQSSTLCLSCRGQLRVSLNHRRLRLVCQETSCAKIWPCVQDGTMLRPLLAHDAPRWCEHCGLVVHRIHIDGQTRSTRQTCKECQRSSTY